MNQVTSDMTRRLAAPASFNVNRVVLNVAWLSALLGAGLEALIFVLNPEPASVLDLLGSIARALVICMGLALAVRVWGSRAHMVGLAGLLAAPVAFYLARFLQDSAAQILAITSASASTSLSPLLLASLKGIEYGCIGIGIAWLEQHSPAGPVPFALVGLMAGLVFGGAILLLGSNGNFSTSTLVAWSINELLFPTGCTLIVFATRAPGRQA